MNIEKEEIYKVDIYELDEEIELFLNSKGIKIKSYETICEEELNNDMIKEFIVESIEPDENTMSYLKRKKFMFKTNDILNWMCYCKVIEPGTYYVNVGW